MEAYLHDFLVQQGTLILFLIVAVMLFLLAKGADILVDEAVTLSVRWKVPTLLIGATIVSLGTTLPETAVSVMAALGGRPGLALGNAVGSIICDTGLILGLAILIGRVPVDKRVVNRQGWIQLGAGIALVLFSFPFSTPGTVFETGGRLPQWAGVIFLICLVIYIYKSITWARKGDGVEMEEVHVDPANSWMVFGKLVLGMFLVIASSHVLIPTVEIIANRFGVPESIIAATLVAFGTSLPELVTAITSVRKGHGGLALGNIIGADILNVLFVAGTAAAVTTGGLEADEHFFKTLFPAMIGILVVFRLAIVFSKDHLAKWAGFLLLGVYVLVTYLSYSS